MSATSRAWPFSNRRLLTCEFADPPVSYPVLQIAELAAGKIKAVMERVAARDLFDLHRLSLQMPALFDDPLARAVALRAVCTADPFPGMASPAEALNRFQVMPREVAEPLAAMLRTGESVDHSADARGCSQLAQPSRAAFGGRERVRTVTR